MNKIILYFVLIFGFLNFCSSATFRITNAKHKDHPDKCYDEDTKHFFSPGESYKPIGRCYVLDCIRPGEISGYSCGKVLMNPDCKKLEQDLTKPHPYCCDSFLCIDVNGEEYLYNPSVPQSLTNGKFISEPLNNNI